MLLGKRSRPTSIMRRTTSMSGGISNNLDSHEVQDSIIDPPHPVTDQNQTNGAVFKGMVMSPSPTTSNNSHPQNQTTIINPAAHVLQLQTPHFLRTCCLCKRHLTPSRDIYMYRGDTAFCSSECREHQIRQDRRKWKVASNKEDHHAPPPTSAANTSNNSGTTACNCSVRVAQLHN